ncbi:hypothetical protein JNJ66_02920 [Candidatus Saccharibacteria bacterium]|nr:hypothetical protein [Candidatus Saccharibacteria bacterium]
MTVQQTVRLAFGLEVQQTLRAALQLRTWVFTPRRPAGAVMPTSSFPVEVDGSIRTARLVRILDFTQAFQLMLLTHQTEARVICEPIAVCTYTSDTGEECYFAVMLHARPATQLAAAGGALLPSEVIVTGDDASAFEHDTYRPRTA